MSFLELALTLEQGSIRPPAKAPVSDLTNSSCHSQVATTPHIHSLPIVSSQKIVPAKRSSSEAIIIGDSEDENTEDRSAKNKQRTSIPASRTSSSNSSRSGNRRKASVSKSKVPLSGRRNGVMRSHSGASNLSIGKHESILSPTFDAFGSQESSNSKGHSSRPSKGHGQSRENAFTLLDDSEEEEDKADVKPVISGLPTRTLPRKGSGIQSSSSALNDAISAPVPARAPVPSLTALPPISPYLLAEYKTTAAYKTADIALLERQATKINTAMRHPRGELTIS